MWGFRGIYQACWWILSALLVPRAQAFSRITRRKLQPLGVIVEPELLKRARLDFVDRVQQCFLMFQLYDRLFVDVY